MALRDAVDSLYAGNQLAWRVRIASWLLLGVPAGFVDPRLVVPALLLSEGVWIAFFQWSRRRKKRPTPNA